MCVRGLTQMTMEQKKTIEGFEKDIKRRDKVIERLKVEHEKLKAKVRKYRSLRQQQLDSQNAEQDNGEIENSFESNPNSQCRSEKDAINLLSGLDEVKKGGALSEEQNQGKGLHCSRSDHEQIPLKISNKENMLPGETCSLPANSLWQGNHSRKVPSIEKNNCNYLQPSNNPLFLSSSEGKAENVGRSEADFHYLKEEAKLHQKEIDLLKGELNVCKQVFMKTGASRAVEKVEQVYNDQISKVDHAHGKIVGLMRKRLEELADCLQKILGLHNGNVSANLLNVSNLSTGDVSMLSDILNESRRLSKSFHASQR